MDCKWLSDEFSAICTNGECPACGDACPALNYAEICRYAENGSVWVQCEYYYQGDDRWRKVQFTSCGKPSQTIGSSGAGPVAMAMVLATWVDKHITPVEMAKLAVDNGFRTMMCGTAWPFFKFVAEKYMFKKFVQTTRMDTLKEGLRQGALAICSMSSGDGNFWTQGGTFVVVVGYGDGYIYAFDPCKRQHPRKQQEDKFKQCLKQAFIFWPFIQWDAKGGEPVGAR